MNGKTIDRSRLAGKAQKPHAMRDVIMFYLDKVGMAGASCGDIAYKIRQPLSNVAYHANVLLAEDAIKVVKVIPCRGTTKRIFVIRSGIVIPEADAEQKEAA